MHANRSLRVPLMLCLASTIVGGYQLRTGLAQVQCNIQACWDAKCHSSDCTTTGVAYWSDNQGNTATTTCKFCSSNGGSGNVKCTNNTANKWCCPTKVAGFSSNCSSCVSLCNNAGNNDLEAKNCVVQGTIGAPTY